MLSLNMSMMSLDAPLDVDPLLSMGDIMPDDTTPGPDLMLEQSEIKDRVQEWLYRLNEKQRYIIEKRYGLNGYEIQTLEQLAATLELTRERVRQIQLEALQTLHDIEAVVSREGKVSRTFLGIPLEVFSGFECRLSPRRRPGIQDRRPRACTFRAVESARSVVRPDLRGRQTVFQRKMRSGERFCR